MSSKLLGNSALPNYVKIVATAILTLTYLAALLVGVDAYVTQGPQAQLPTVVAFILGTGLTTALGVLNLHQGASLAETPSPLQPPPVPPVPVSNPPDSSNVSP